METKVLLSEEDHRKCARAALCELEDYRKRNVARWVEVIIAGLQPRSRNILAETMPIDLYIWAAQISPNILRMLEESLDPQKQV